MSRTINDGQYLKYLLVYLNLNDLKQICRDFNLKGYSKFKKVDLLDFIVGSLAEEELLNLIDDLVVEYGSEKLRMVVFFC